MHDCLPLIPQLVRAILMQRRGPGFKSPLEAKVFSLKNYFKNLLLKILFKIISVNCEVMAVCNILILILISLAACNSINLVHKDL